MSQELKTIWEVEELVTSKQRELVINLKNWICSYHTNISKWRAFIFSNLLKEKNVMCNVDLKNQCNVDLLRSSARKLRKICPVSAGKSAEDVPLPMFRCGTSFKDFYRISGNSSDYSETKQHENHFLLTRHAITEPGNRGSGDDHRKIGLSL